MPSHEATRDANTAPLEKPGLRPEIATPSAEKRPTTAEDAENPAAVRLGLFSVSECILSRGWHVKLNGLVHTVSQAGTAGGGGVKRKASEVVEASGHLIDSGILNAIFDTVIRHGASFEVLQFSIGRTNTEPSVLSMRLNAESQAVILDLVEDLVPLGCQIASPKDAITRIADQDGCAPVDFYSTTNNETHIRRDGHWITVQHQRMDVDDRPRRRPGDVPQTARRAQRRPRRLRRARHPRRARCSRTATGWASRS